MNFFQKLSNFKVKIVTKNCWVKNNKKQKKMWYNIFFVFCCLVKKIDEVKLTITFEPNMRFEWDKTHNIKEQNLLFHLKTTSKKALYIHDMVAPYLNLKSQLWLRLYVWHNTLMACCHTHGKTLFLITLMNVLYLFSSNGLSMKSMHLFCYWIIWNSKYLWVLPQLVLIQINEFHLKNKG